MECPPIPFGWMVPQRKVTFLHQPWVAKQTEIYRSIQARQLPRSQKREEDPPALPGSEVSPFCRTKEELDGTKFSRPLKLQDGLRPQAIVISVTDQSYQTDLQSATR